MNETPKVALLIETSRGFGRQVLRGVARYSRLHGPWGFFITPGDFEQALPKMREWGGTGIIARIETKKIADAILESGLPTIALDLSVKQLDPSHPLSQLCELSSDSVGAAAMAAAHLLERGFRQYAFVGVAGRVWSERRQAGFCETIRAAGFDVHVYQPPRRIGDQTWGREQPILAEWLSKLPKPIGLMACSDDRGRAVLEACRIARIRVPEEIAAIGVDNDELLCELADPPLSSVNLNAEGVGYRAAGLLDQMMRHGSRESRRLVAEPTFVVTRRSSDITSIEDSVVAAAMGYVNDHAAEPIQVADIVRHCDVSRRNLEIRFQKHLGRTIRDELQRVRMGRADRFLAESDLPVTKIAEAVGFTSPSYFIQVFLETHGTTPAKYRRHLRDEHEHEFE